MSQHFLPAQSGHVMVGTDRYQGLFITSFDKDGEPVETPFNFAPTYDMDLLMIHIARLSTLTTEQRDELRKELEREFRNPGAFMNVHVDHREVR